jgi:hypothetical protein
MSEVQELLAKADEIQKNQEKTLAKDAEQPQSQPEYVCPVCNQPASQFEVQAQEEDKREFMRCVLGDKLFCKTYTVGNDAIKGGMKWRLQLLTGQQAEHMDLLIDEIVRDENIPGKRKIRLIHDTKLLFYLRTIGDKQFKPPENVVQESANDCRPFSVSDIQELFRERFGAQSEMVTTIGLRLVVTFEQLVAVLTQTVFDQSFWKGAGLV